MDLEAVALEAVKVKIQEIFDEIIVTTGMEGRDIVIRISLPDEIGNKSVEDRFSGDKFNADMVDSKINANLDKEAQAAADELLGTNKGDL